MTTIYDIAKQVGCAPSTVSRALAGVYGVKEKTKQEILRAAQELNYIPDSTAKNLKTQRSWNIGVIINTEGLSGLKHYLFTSILDSFSNVVEESNFDVTLFSKKVVSSGQGLLTHCRSKRLDGVFIVCGDFREAAIKELLSSEIPVVAVDYLNPEDESLNCVSSDNRRKMYDLTEYLIQNGHRNLVFMTGQDVYVTNERIKGFQSALKAHGIDFREDMLVRGEYYNLDLAFRMTKEILSRKNPPTAILLPDDYCAISAYDAISEMGLKIPEDVSVAGFDGLEIARRIIPSLTTVIQDTQRIGECAANKLLRLINEGEQKGGSISLIEAKLYEGESVRKLNESSTYVKR